MITKLLQLGYDTITAKLILSFSVLSFVSFAPNLFTWGITAEPELVMFKGL